MIDLTISSDEEEVMEVEKPAVEADGPLSGLLVGEVLASEYKLAPSWFSGRRGDGWERIAQRRGVVVT